MRRLLKPLKFVLFALLLLFSHYLVLYLLPAPWKFFNIFNLFFVFYIMGWEKGGIIWLSALVYFFLELYALTPFGFFLLPGVISVMAIYILYMNIFTNRSWHTALILTGLSAIFNKAIFVMLLALSDFSALRGRAVWATLLSALGWEIILTASLTAGLVFVLSVKTSRFAGERLKLNL